MNKISFHILYFLIIESYAWSKNELLTTGSYLESSSVVLIGSDIVLIDRNKTRLKLWMTFKFIKESTNTLRILQCLRDWYRFWSPWRLFCFIFEFFFSFELVVIYICIALLSESCSCLTLCQAFSFYPHMLINFQPKTDWILSSI